MLNPNLSNFEIFFSEDFFPEKLTKKYNDFLFHKNNPMKDMQSYFYETIQNMAIPGINLNTQTVQGVNNTGLDRNKPSKNGFPHSTVNFHYPGNTPQNEVIDAIAVNITFRNTILNWMYCYEVLYSFYKRTRDIERFQIILTMNDSAEIPMFRFIFSGCFASVLPGLEFAYNAPFNDVKTFDCAFTFNQFDVEFIAPNFNINTLDLSNIENV